MVSIFSRVKEVVKNTDGKIIASTNMYALVRYPTNYDRDMRMEQLSKSLRSVKLSKVGNDKVYIDWS